ncbi:MAG TPA: DUF3048 domain-containing protein [Candidatus Coprovivens excrementavium]|nr:DUF3048 domain-containing protein [Candidatus Coprovivens excrementavium]
MAKRKNKKKKFIGFLILGIFLLVGSYLVYINFNFEDGVINNKKEEKKLQIVDENSDTRPIAVMINNHDSARPYHTGLQDAYLVYEIIVEGGYTRYMAVYKDKDTEKIGSVRSARPYFLDYVLENDALYVHWGWSEQAEADIARLGINNINGLSYENVYFYRDNNLPINYEHRGFTSMELINKGIDDLGYRKTTSKDLLLNYSIDDVDLSTLDGVIKANNIDITYSGLVTTSYKYDADNKVYLRYVNDVAHTDYGTKKQYTTKNIIVYQVSNYMLIGDVKGRQVLDNVGTTSGYYISNGYAVPIVVTKNSRSGQTKYSLQDGSEINVNDGNTFIQIQPEGKDLKISE